MVFIWYFNGIYIGAKTEARRKKCPPFALKEGAHYFIPTKTGNEMNPESMARNFRGSLQGFFIIGKAVG